MFTFFDIEYKWMKRDKNGSFIKNDTEEDKRVFWSHSTV